MKLSLGFSPCPNDTFIFDALVNHKIETDGLEFDVVLEDVQTLNKWALDGRLDISKISYGVLPHVLEKYIVLNSGGALGKGVGPLLITRPANDRAANPAFDPENMTVAIPGENTTANLLFSLAFPTAKNKRFMLFSEIENAVLTKSVDAGVIIHENRFTYMKKGLIKILDLGEFWEKETASPIPLGGIIIKRTLDHRLQKRINGLITESINFAFASYPAVTDYVKEHSQEMEEQVMLKHIDLYVNNYSIDLQAEGKKAVMKLLEVHSGLDEKFTRDNIFVN